MTNALAVRPEDIVSVPHKVAAKIARLTPRQVTYWEAKQVARPTVVRPVQHGDAPAGRRVVRLYDYTELLALLIAAELRDRNVTLQHIRKVVDHIRARGYPHPLTDVRFATVGRELYFEHPEDGTWEGGLRPDQIVFHEVLRLQPLRMRILEGIQRSPETVGQVERRRGALGSKQLVSGTRIPVDTVRRYLTAGRSHEQIVASFTALTVEDIDAVANLV